MQQKKKTLLWPQPHMLLLYICLSTRYKFIGVFHGNPTSVLRLCIKHLQIINWMLHLAMVAVALRPGNSTSLNVLQRACMHRPSKVRNYSSFIKVILLINRNKRKDLLPCRKLNKAFLYQSKCIHYNTPPCLRLKGFSYTHSYH